MIILIGMLAVCPFFLYMQARYEEKLERLENINIALEGALREALDFETEEAKDNYIDNIYKKYEEQE